jgi:GNAT superfamily N-acetyltransferase
MTVDESRLPLPVALRLATEADEPFLIKLYADSREAEMAALGWDEPQRTAFVLHQFAAQTTHYLRYFPHAKHDIIEAEGLPVGRLWVERNQDEIRILDLLVLTGTRRQGIGGGLVQALQAEAERELKPLRVSIETLSPARSLFDQLGFVPEEEKGPHLLLAWEPAALSGQETN